MGGVSIERAQVVLSAYAQSYLEYVQQRECIQGQAGNIARSMRHESGLSLRKYAERLSVSPSFLSKVERGKEALSPDLAGRMLIKEA